MSEQEQNESLDFILSEACSREGLDKPQLVLAGATLPKAAQLQGYVQKVPADATCLENLSDVPNIVGPYSVLEFTQG